MPPGCPPVPLPVPPQVDPEAEELLDALLARKPEDRPSTAQVGVPPRAACGAALLRPPLALPPRPALLLPAQLMEHPWFKTDLPPGAEDLNDRLLASMVDDPTLAERVGALVDAAGRQGGGLQPVLRMTVDIYPAA